MWGSERLQLPAEASRWFDSMGQACLRVLVWKNKGFTSRACAQADWLLDACGAVRKKFLSFLSLALKCAVPRSEHRHRSTTLLACRKRKWEAAGDARELPAMKKHKPSHGSRAEKQSLPRQQKRKPASRGSVQRWALMNRKSQGSIWEVHAGQFVPHKRLGIVTVAFRIGLLLRVEVEGANTEASAR